MLTLFLLTIVLLACAAYAQYRLPYHTANATRAWATRLVLAVTGFAFGFVVASRYSVPGDIAYLLLLFSGFGLVHVPAAAILFLKRKQQAARESR